MPRSFHVFSLCLALLSGLCLAASPQEADASPFDDPDLNVVLVGEDADKDTLRRSHRATRAVMTALTDAVRDRGWSVFREKAAHEGKKLRRRPAERALTQMRYNGPLSRTEGVRDVALVLSLRPEETDRDGVRLTVVGHVAALPSGKPLARFDVKAEEAGLMDRACNARCRAGRVEALAQAAAPRFADEALAKLEKAARQMSRGRGPQVFEDPDKRGYTVAIKHFSKRDIRALQRSFERIKTKKDWDVTYWKTGQTRLGPVIWMRTNLAPKTLRRALAKAAREAEIEARVRRTDVGFSIVPESTASEDRFWTSEKGGRS